jgi:sec-independent protein translocase protein TatC
MTDRLPADRSAPVVQSFLGHLDDLRRAVVWALAAVAGGMLTMLALAPRVLRWLEHPLRAAGMDPASFLRVLRVTGGVDMLLRLVLWGGLVLAAPFVVLAAAWFVFPGLTARERRVVRRAGCAGAGLFAVGAATGYFLVLPPVLQVLRAMNAWLGVTSDFVEWGSYVSFVGKLVLAFGAAYELPLVLLVLGGMGLVASAGLRRVRRHVIVGLLVAGMLLTPPDPLSQVLLAVPLMALYEACIWLLWLRERRLRNAGGDS